MSESVSPQWCVEHGVHLLTPGEIPEVGMADPSDELLVALVQAQLQCRITPVAMASERIRSEAGAKAAEIQEEADALLNDNLRGRLGDSGWEAEPVIRLVEAVVNEALKAQATDVHFEPEEDQIKVRFRKDGMLVVHQELPGWVRDAVIGRLKIMANMDIAEKRVPQDGRITWPWRGSDVDVRASTLPTRFGEKVVLRLLRQLVAIKQLEQLAMPNVILERMAYYFERPQGMIFVTGPTGSGKSSTLYAGLQQIIHKHINITTIEDPIEYDLPGANQVQIHEKAGLTFAGALRSILRQDPDVILVGEIRDSETARIAVQAAQTGHLVLSTLHTNDSFSAVTRLKDLGVEPFLIGNAVLGILAQRLVRRVCPACVCWEAPTPVQKRLLPDLPDRVPQAKGCSECAGMGYRGRVAVFELLPISREVRQCILDNGNEADLRRLGGINPLMDDGMGKMLQGLTTPDELLRVLQTDAEF
jgi:type IV pilus assembly protein PilB